MNVTVKRKIAIDYIKIKAGSILLWKEYSPLKKLWAKITRKTLPYNQIALFIDSCDYIGNPKEDLVLLELKKNYSKKEINKLSILIGNEYFEDFSAKVDDLCSILNIVRPNTFNENYNSIIDLLNGNKYYTIKNLKNAEEWKEFLY